MNLRYAIFTNLAARNISGSKDRGILMHKIVIYISVLLAMAILGAWQPTETALSADGQKQREEKNLFKNNNSGAYHEENRAYDERQFNDHSENSEMSAPFLGEDPAKTVDSIAARANDWHEPSRRSEERYVLAIRQWLDSLQPFQRERAKKILHEAHPGLRALRMAIREKKAQLAALSFDRDTKPETLPRLGQELQALRDALRGKLKAVAKRLKHEAGVPMGPLGGDGFWLAPPDDHNDSHSTNSPRGEVQLG